MVMSTGALLKFLRASRVNKILRHIGASPVSGTVKRSFAPCFTIFCKGHSMLRGRRLLLGGSTRWGPRSVPSAMLLILDDDPPSFAKNRRPNVGNSWPMLRFAFCRK